MSQTAVATRFAPTTAPGNWCASEKAATSKALIVAGKQLARYGLATPPIEQREFLSKVIGRIVQLLATVSLTKGRHLITVEAVDQDDSFSPAHIFVNVP